MKTNFAKKILKISTISIFSVFVLMQIVFLEYASADTTEIKTISGEKFIYTLLQPLPQEGKDLHENVTLKEYLTWAFRFTLALAGFLAVMMIVIGGVEYIISGANEGARTEANKRIWGAISGLVMALVAYLVLYTINPSLVDFENNQFFKEKETTSTGNNNGSSDTNTKTESSSSNVDLPNTEKSGDSVDSTPTNPLNSGSGVLRKEQ